MSVDGFDHVNIQTRDLAATVRFFEAVLDLRAGDPPPGLDPARIQWMFDGAQRPLFHLLTVADAPRGSGSVHHVALECSDFDAMTARLDQLAVPYRVTELPAIDLRQVFVTEPNGTLLELNFRGR